MSQGDQSIANQAGAAFRADLNAELQALVSFSRGATEPSPTYVGQEWDDATSNTKKRRNAANSAWLVVSSLDETFVVARSSNTILGLSDYGKTFVATSSFTQTLTAAATLGDGWYCFYRNDGSGVITLDPNSSETIDGFTTRLLQPGESCRIVCNGSAFKTQGTSVNFTSAETTIPSPGTVATVAHGLAAVPAQFSAVFRCKTAEFGYSIGDEVAVGSSTTSGNLTFWADATNLGISSVNAGPYNVANRTSHVSSAITVGNWKLVFRAWL